MILLTHRYYDPSTGRFVNRDPIGYQGGINLYTFAGGNPVNQIDPDGTQGQIQQFIQNLAQSPNAQRALNWLQSRGSQHALQLQQAMARQSQPLPNGITQVGNKLFGDYSTLGRYNALNNIVGQAHHFLQNAAFSRQLPQAMRIPNAQGLTVNLQGNVFTQANSPHWKAHKVIEDFWNLYRAGGPRFLQTPTVGEYVQAMRRSLQAAGLSKNEVGHAITLLKRQFQQNGITMDTRFLDIPGRINLARP